ncbi:hypothetical protein [Saccharococcus caldoxylosilyticus]|uniref:Uncharacterized protein n=1 Tax=Saccharococcus caldoxylosilyticus TaxID=81408 RepID=A0A150LBY2_9BACL|nr:hypothetical protein [Parageobacillus caldoxylosilyticus]KYD09847.1 hypothetical protein B4119_2695 [Parageobacillus caldoxylosilyticus]
MQIFHVAMESSSDDSRFSVATDGRECRPANAFARGKAAFASISLDFIDQSTLSAKHK